MHAQIAGVWTEDGASQSMLVVIFVVVVKVLPSKILQSLRGKFVKERDEMARSKPNILVTGTPGTGKTSTCSLLADAVGLSHINCGDLVKSKSLHDGWDDELECFIVNDDLLIDEMEDMVKAGGNLVDYHSCDIFPERWFDAVVVLQTDNGVLYERLTNRGYTGPKLQNNMECEIFQVLLEEARENYVPEIVRALPSNTIEDMSNNVEVLGNWIRAWSPPVTAPS